MQLRRYIYIIGVITVLAITGCSGCDDAKNATQTNISRHADFDQSIGVADSLYNCMQFRDAYKLYLQLLDSKEAEAINYKKMYWDEKWAQTQAQAQTSAAGSNDLRALTDEQLFLHINEVVVHERLFLDPNFDRQAIMDRFRQHYGMSPSDYRTEAANK